MRLLALKKLGILLLYTSVFLETVLCTISYGKLKIKVPPDHNALGGRSTVVATRNTSFLNKDGDIFKLHKPAILKDALSDSISFESLRFPGAFLRANVDKGLYNFRIEKPELGDDDFNKTASFLIQRNTGVRGSGMLRLMEQPSYYMCVDTDGFKPTLRAMRDDDTTTDRSNLKEKCSFYIQKLRPLGLPVLPSPSPSPFRSNSSLKILLGLKDLKDKDAPQPLSIKEGLHRLAKSLEGTGDISTLHAINSVIHHLQSGGTPSPSLVRHLLNDYEDKIRIYQKKEAKELAGLRAKKANEDSAKLASKKGTLAEEAAIRAHETENRNVLFNPSPSHPSYMPYISRTLSVKKNERKVYVRRKIGNNGNPALLDQMNNKRQQTSQVSLKNDTLSLMTSLLPYFDPSKIPALDFSNIDGPLKNDTISLTRSMLQYLYPQTAPVNGEPTGHPSELTKMGPYPPINLGDFAKQTHREPSLNMDGLVSSISVPQTRSNASISTMTIPETYSFKNEDDGKNSFENALPNKQLNNISHTTGSKLSDLPSPVNNDANKDQQLTMYYVKKNTNNTDNLGADNLNKQAASPTTNDIKAGSDHETLKSNISNKDVTGSSNSKENDSTDPGNSTISDVSESSDIKSDESTARESSGSNFNDSSDGGPDDFLTSMFESNSNNSSDDKNNKAENTDNNTNKQTSTHESPVAINGDTNNTVQNKSEPGNQTSAVLYPVSADKQNSTNNTVNRTVVNNATLVKSNETFVMNDQRQINQNAKNSTRNESLVKAASYDANDPLKDLIAEFKNRNTHNNSAETVNKANQSNETKVVKPKASNTSPSNDKNSYYLSNKNGDKIYSYNDDDEGTTLDTKNINSVFGVSKDEDERLQLEKEINDKLFKNSTSSYSNSTSSVTPVALQDKNVPLKQIEGNIDITKENITSATRTTNSSSFESKQHDQTSVSSVPLKSNVEHVEFAKQVMAVGIAVGDKGQSDNMTKPVLAKSYVKDKKNDTGKNTTHTIDGNFIVKYDEPLSETTTREIANNIFKAVFNTLNKTTVPSGASGASGASNGVERATIEKNKYRKITKNMLLAPFERFKNDDDDGGEEGTAKDKTASYNPSYNDRIRTNLGADKISNDTSRSRLPNTDHNDSIANYNERIYKRNESIVTNNENAYKRYSQEKKMATFEEATQTEETHHSSEEPAHEMLKAINAAPAPEVPSPVELSRLKNHSMDDVQKFKDDDNKTEENSQNKGPLVLGKDAKDANDNDTVVKTGKKNGKKDNKDDNTLAVPDSKDQKLLEKDKETSKDIKSQNKDKELLEKDKETSKDSKSQNKEKELLEKDKETSKDAKSQNKNNGAAEPGTAEKANDKQGNDGRLMENPNIKEDSTLLEKNGSTIFRNVSTGGHTMSPTHDDEEAKQIAREQKQDDSERGMTPEDNKLIQEAAAKVMQNPQPEQSIQTNKQMSQPSEEPSLETNRPANPQSIQTNKQMSQPSEEPSLQTNRPANTQTIQPITQTYRAQGQVGNASTDPHSATGPHGSVQRHTNHIITVKDDNEKEALLNKLVNYDYDKCVFMKLINDIKSPYRLISSVNRHGYKPRGLVFTLKTVLKDPDLHQFVAFRAIDENDPKRVITLDGQKDLVAVPVMCHGSPRIVHVESQQPPKAIANAMARILSETRSVDGPGGPGPNAANPPNAANAPNPPNAANALNAANAPNAANAKKKYSIPVRTEAAHKKHRIPYALPLPRGKPINAWNMNSAVKSAVTVVRPVTSTVSGNEAAMQNVMNRNQLTKSTTYSLTKTADVRSRNTPIKSAFSFLKFAVNGKFPSSPPERPAKIAANQKPLAKKTKANLPAVNGNIATAKSSLSRYPPIQTKVNGNKPTKTLVPGASMFMAAPYASQLASRWNVTLGYPTYYASYNNGMSSPYSQFRFIKRRSDISRRGYRHHFRPLKEEYVNNSKRRYLVDLEDEGHQKRRRVLMQDGSKWIGSR